MEPQAVVVPVADFQVSCQGKGRKCKAQEYLLLPEYQACHVPVIEDLIHELLESDEI